MTSSDKEVRAVLKAMEEQGWTVRQGHTGYTCFHPDGKRTAHVPHRMGGGTTLKKVLNNLRNSGLELD